MQPSPASSFSSAATLSCCRAQAARLARASPAGARSTVAATVDGAPSPRRAGRAGQRAPRPRPAAGVRDPPAGPRRPDHRAAGREGGAARGVIGRGSLLTDEVDRKVRDARPQARSQLVYEQNRQRFGDAHPRRGGGRRSCRLLGSRRRSSRRACFAELAAGQGQGGGQRSTRRGRAWTIPGERAGAWARRRAGHDRRVRRLPVPLLPARPEHGATRCWRGTPARCASSTATSRSTATRRPCPPRGPRAARASRASSGSTTASLLLDAGRPARRGPQPARPQALKLEPGALRHLPGLRPPRQGDPRGPPRTGRARRQRDAGLLHQRPLLIGRAALRGVREIIEAELDVARSSTDRRLDIRAAVFPGRVAPGRHATMRLVAPSAKEVAGQVADRAPGLDGQGRPRALQRQRLGPGLLHASTKPGNVEVTPGRARARRASTSRSWSTTSAAAASTSRSSSASPTSCARRVAAALRRLPAGHRRERLQGRATAASTRSRSTSSATWSRSWSSTAGPSTSASRRAASPSCWSPSRCRTTPRRSILCNGYKDRALHRDRAARPEARPQGHHHHRPHRRARHRSCTPRRELGIRPVIGVRARLVHQGRGQVGRVDRRPLEVRPHHRRDRGGRRAAARARACSTASSCSTSTSARRSPPSAPSRTRCARRAASSSSCTRWARNMRYLDCGGGLGVDYDGSQTNFHSSVNYSLQEYAADVVSQIAEACNAKGVPHPDIVTESGRALVAHHSVLVFNVLGTNEMLRRPDARSRWPRTSTAVIQQLYETYAGVSRKNFQEAYHDALQLKEEAITAFNLGFLDLQGAGAGRAALLGHLREDPEDRPRPALRARRARGPREAALRHLLLQLLGLPVAARPLGGAPALPHHADPPPRTRQPTRRAVLADLTCDSDGKMDQFIDLRDVKHFLELHPLNGEPYYIASFLVGRLPGDPGRPAQPVRRHRRRPRPPRRRRLPRRARGRGRLGDRGAVLRAVLQGRPRSPACGAPSRWRCARSASPRPSRAASCAATKRPSRATRT